MTIPDPAEPGVVCSFLQQLLRDREAGEFRPLSEYQSTYPGFEAVIAREFEALDDAGGPTQLLISQRFELRGELGRGGMGTVHRAWDRELRREVALKVLRPECSQKLPAAPLRFLEEAQVTGQLQHPNIVPVHEYGRDEAGQAFYTMPLVAGRNLGRIFELAREGAEGWDRGAALDVLLRVCDALAFAHEQGVLHRDLKPANIMVGDFGEVYVMDWGLAGQHRTAAVSDAGPNTLRRELSAASRGDALQTQVGDILGTPAYMPPEQAAGDLAAMGPWSDCYAIGVMVAELWSGAESCAAMPPELEAIVQKSCAATPADRYQGAADLAKDLRAYRTGHVVQSFERGAWIELRKWVARNRSLALALGGVAVAVVIGLVVSLMLHATSQRHAANWEQEYRRGLIEQGKLFARAGDLHNAEKILWRAFLAKRSEASVWALCELYQRHPCLGAQRLDHRVSGLAFCATRQELVAADEGGGMQVFDARSLRFLRRLESPHIGPVLGLVSLGDTRVASAGRDGSVYLWNLEGSAAPQVIPPPAGRAAPAAEIRALDFDRRRGQLALGRADGSVEIWDPRGLDKLLDITARPRSAAISALRFCHQTSTLAMGFADGRLELRAAASGAIRRLDAGKRRLFCLAFSVDGATLFAGSRDTRLRAWRLADGGAPEVLPLKNGSVYSIVPGADGETVMVGTMFRMEIRRLPSLELAQTIPIRDTWTARLSPDGRLATGHTDGELRLWDLGGRDGQVRTTLGSRALALAFHPDRDELVAGDLGGGVHWLRMPDGQRIASYSIASEKGPTLPVRSLRHSARGGLLAISFSPPQSTARGRLQVLAMPGRQLLQEFSEHESITDTSACFDPDDGSLLIGQPQGWVARVDPRTGQSLQRFRHEERQTLGVCSSGETVFTVGRSPWIQAWNRDGQPRRRFRDAKTTPWSLELSGDQQLLACGDWGGNIEVYDARTGEARRVLQGHGGLITGLAFHPGDGRLLASTSTDRSLRIWDLETGQCLMVRDDFSGLVSRVAWSPGGRWLAVATLEDLRIWDLEAMRRRVAGNLSAQLQLRQGELSAEARGAAEAWARALR